MTIKEYTTAACVMDNQVLIFGSGEHAHKKLIPSLDRLNYKIIGGVVRQKNKFSDATICEITISELPTILEKYQLHQIVTIIATPPSNHLTALKTLYNLGLRRFVIEKPIFLSTKELQQARKLTDASIQSINMYEVSPVWKTFLTNLQHLIRSEPDENITINFNFNIPETAIDKNNFRKGSIEDLGAIGDIGYYPVSALYLLAEYLKLQYTNVDHVVENSEIGIPHFGCFTGKLQSNIKVQGSWGFRDYYRNSVHVTSAKSEFDIDFLFSKPRVGMSTLNCSKDGTITSVPIEEKFDQFDLELVRLFSSHGRTISDKLHDFVLENFDRMAALCSR